MSKNIIRKTAVAAVKQIMKNNSWAFVPALTQYKNGRTKSAGAPLIVASGTGGAALGYAATKALMQNMFGGTRPEDKSKLRKLIETLGGAAGGLIGIRLAEGKDKKDSESKKKAFFNNIVNDSYWKSK